MFAAGSVGVCAPLNGIVLGKALIGFQTDKEIAQRVADLAFEALTKFTNTTKDGNWPNFQPPIRTYCN